jgi:plastocyanin
MNDATTETPEQTDGSGEQPPAVEPAAEEKVPFWHRPNIERYVVPIVLPIAVILGIIVFILSISRIFLSAGGHIPIIIGVAILLLILLGSSLLAKAAHRLRQGSIAMVTIGFVVAIMLGGLLVVGKSEEKKVAGSGTLACSLKTKQTVQVVVSSPSGALKFTPNSLNATTGLATVSGKAAGTGHTLAINDPTTQFQTIDFNALGTVSCVAFFPHAGDYSFECTVDSHAAAGMTGTIHVTGPTMTLQQAEAAAGNPPSAGA